jgi:hypothetical protein
METYGRVDLYNHVFLTSALVRGDYIQAPATLSCGGNYLVTQWLWHKLHGTIYDILCKTFNKNVSQQSWHIVGSFDGNIYL